MALRREVALIDCTGVVTSVALREKMGYTDLFAKPIIMEPAKTIKRAHDLQSRMKPAPLRTSIAGTKNLPMICLVRGRIIPAANPPNVAQASDIPAILEPPRPLELRKIAIVGVKMKKTMQNRSM